MSCAIALEFRGAPGLVSTKCYDSRAVPKGKFGKGVAVMKRHKVHFHFATLCNTLQHFLACVLNVINSEIQTRHKAMKVPVGARFSRTLGDTLRQKTLREEPLQGPLKIIAWQFLDQLQATIVTGMSSTFKPGGLLLWDHCNDWESQRCGGLCHLRRRHHSHHRSHSSGSSSSISIRSFEKGLAEGGGWLKEIPLMPHIEASFLTFF